jgi:protein O-mannosyl-transferase
MARPRKAVNQGAEAPRVSRAQTRNWQRAAAWALLLCVTLIAYWPALQGGFVWDDSAHATAPELRSLHGLWRIWFDVGATQQYYPLLHSAFWLEYRLWGEAVLGYHLVGILLHALAACLLVAILRRLEVPGAWLAGFVFALHPVCVEAVAWISEQKSTLSTVFYLGAALAYLHFDRTRRWRQYALALGLFLLALLSKTVTASLPAALLLVFWWQRGKLEWKRDAMPLLAWFAVGAGAGLFTARVERTLIGAEGAEFGMTFVERCLLAGRAIWFYLGQLLWPSDLVFLYPRWKMDASAWWQYLFPAAVLALVVGLALYARRHRGPLAAFLFFAGTLFPALGFFNVYPFLYSYVADHFQYLASIGVIVFVSSALVLAARKYGAAGAWPATLAGSALLFVLGGLSWAQSANYQNAETLWQATIARNPGCWLAHNNLGADLLEFSDRAPEALAHLETAVRLKPDYWPARTNLGSALAKLDRPAEAIAQYEIVLRAQPGSMKAHNNLGNSLAGAGRYEEAVREFQAALRTEPNAARVHNNLGSALSNLGRLTEAIAEFETAVRLDPSYAEAQGNRGLSLLMAGRMPEAIDALRAATRMQPNSARTRSQFAFALLKVGNLPEAVAEFDAAMRLEPQSPMAHFNLGYALSRMPGRLGDAIAEYQTAVSGAPDFADAHKNLGNALLKAGRVPEAVAAFEQVVRLRPGDSGVRQQLGELKATGGAQ